MRVPVRTFRRQGHGQSGVAQGEGRLGRLECPLAGWPMNQSISPAVSAIRYHPAYLELIRHARLIPPSSREMFRARASIAPRVSCWSPWQVALTL